MTDAETRLAEFWVQTGTPARDLVFELGVQQAIARRRFLIDIAGLTAGVLVVGAFVLALGRDALAGAGVPVSSFDAVGPVLAAVAAIGAAMVWFGRAPADEA
jgi:hypothetical protein